MPTVSGGPVANKATQQREKLQAVLPDWLKPENTSVFDPWYRRPIRDLVNALGLNDPAQLQMLVMGGEMPVAGVRVPMRPGTRRALRLAAERGESATAKESSSAMGDLYKDTLDKILTARDEVFDKVRRPWSSATARDEVRRPSSSTTWDPTFDDMDYAPTLSGGEPIQRHKQAAVMEPAGLIFRRKMAEFYEAHDERVRKQTYEQAVAMAKAAMAKDYERRLAEGLVDPMAEPQFVGKAPYSYPSGSPMKSGIYGAGTPLPPYWQRGGRKMPNPESGFD